MRNGSHPRNQQLRIALLLLGAAVMALLVTQCRMVGDATLAPNGVGLAGSHPENHGNCISECAHAYADSNQVESALHASILKGCGGDASCIANENARYAAVTARIEAGRKACFDDCHHQGGGAGGR